MKLEDFDYHLPEELIAQEAIEPRDQARLFYFDKSKNQKLHKKVEDLVDLIPKNSVLVFNKSRVIPARIKWEKNEILLSKPAGENKWEAVIYPGKRFKLGKEYVLEGVKMTVEKIFDDGQRIINFDLNGRDFYEWLGIVGKLPVPPYINKKSVGERYQTTYSELGDGKSIAAPTAGLHFTDALLEKLKNKGVQIEFVHLDIGLGTFLPIRVDEILDHKMHLENFSIDNDVAERLNSAKEDGKKIITVGTTSIRVLETVAAKNNGKLIGFNGETDIFIYPGYKWSFVDEIITNFHLPLSTLLMLTSAYLGKEETLDLYKEAVEEKYRFFSFGDAMYLKR